MAAAEVPGLEGYLQALMARVREAEPQRRRAEEELAAASRRLARARQAIREE